MKSVNAASSKARTVSRSSPALVPESTGGPVPWLLRRPFPQSTRAVAGGGGGVLVH